MSSTGRRRDPLEFIELFGAVKKRVSLYAAQAYATEDMSSMQAKFVRYVGRHAPCSQAELARATLSDPTLTGRVLATLIERGLVRRERSDEDRREYVLELAPAGRRMFERLNKVRLQLASRISAALDDRDFEDFERIAQKLLATLDEPG